MKTKINIGDIILIEWSDWFDLGLVVETEDSWIYYYLLDASELPKDIPFNDWIGHRKHKFKYVYYCDSEDKIRLIERNNS